MGWTDFAVEIIQNHWTIRGMRTSDLGIRLCPMEARRRCYNTSSSPTTTIDPDGLWLLILPRNVELCGMIRRYSGILQFSTYVSQVAFYIPFYFQAVQGVSPTTSGVRFIPLALSQIVFLVATGVIVTKWGYYVSWFNPLLS